MNLENAHLGGGIVAKSIFHGFGDELVINDISFSFPDYTLVAILGPSGCGKTTLLRCAAGLIKPNSGDMKLDGVVPQEVRKQGGLGFAFQHPTLLPWRNALQNVLLPLEILGRNPREREEHAKDLLHLVELSGDFDKLPRELSGGMQQRVSLARSLVTSPSFLFLDEPFGALDGITRDRLNERLRVYWERNKLSIIFVTHSIEEAVFLAEYILIMSARPSRIKKIIPINLGSERDARTRILNEYFGYQTEIRRLVE